MQAESPRAVPHQHGENNIMKEVILNAGPKALPLKMTGTTEWNITAVRNFLQSCSFFGYSHKCILNGEAERFGMPSYRYQVKGKREKSDRFPEHLRKLSYRRDFQGREMQPARRDQCFVQQHCTTECRRQHFKGSQCLSWRGLPPPPLPGYFCREVLQVCCFEFGLY